MSMYLAKKCNSRVTGVDADKNMRPYFELHAEENGVKAEFMTRRFERLDKDDFKGFHTIVGADICFWDKLAPILYKMIRRALKAGVKQVVIADPGRTSFWKLVDKCEKNLECECFTRKLSSPVKAETQILIVTGLEPLD